MGSTALRDSQSSPWAKALGVLRDLVEGPELVDRFVKKCEQRLSANRRL